MTKLLLISDNHGDNKIIDKILKLEKYDLSAHLGDSLQPEEVIKKKFDIYVSGNNEFFSTFEEIWEIEGLRVVFIHGHTASIIDRHEERGYEFAKDRKADVLIFGHTHTPYNKDVNGIRFINPGSTTYPRNASVKSYALVTFEDGKVINVVFKNL